VEVWAPLLAALIVAAVIVCAATVALVLLVRTTNRERREDRKLDLKRQDAVAEQAREVAEQARETASLLVQSNERFAAVARTTNSKLDTIHGLVNSNLTAAMLAELGATEAGLALMRELTDDREARGIKPSPEAKARIIATEKRINDLKAQVRDRQDADRTAKRQADDVV
jgi:urease gamma subunit